MVGALSLLVAPTLSLLLTTSPPHGINTVTRRTVIGGLFLTPAAAFAADTVDYLTVECDEREWDKDCDEKKQKAIKDAIKNRAKRAAAKRIEDSKKGPTRKPTDLVENRKKTVDYSCVAATGSPCPTSEEPN